MHDRGRTHNTGTHVRIPVATVGLLDQVHGLVLVGAIRLLDEDGGARGGLSELLLLLAVTTWRTGLLLLTVLPSRGPCLLLLHLTTLVPATATASRVVRTRATTRVAALASAVGITAVGGGVEGLLLGAHADGGRRGLRATRGHHRAVRGSPGGIVVCCRGRWGAAVRARAPTDGGRGLVEAGPVWVATEAGWGPVVVELGRGTVVVHVAAAAGGSAADSAHLVRVEALEDASHPVVAGLDLGHVALDVHVLDHCLWL